MPRKPRIPTYRFHKASNQAVVVIAGRSFYLGAWNSPESRAEYRRVVSEHWHPAAPAARTPRAAAPPMAVVELILAYWERRVVPYYRKDGRPTSEQDNIRQALRFLRKSHGQVEARRFGPLALQAVRRTMIEAGRSRRLINKDVHRIRAMFRWAASQELYPGEALAALESVVALEKGRTEAREAEPVGPVDLSVVDATLAQLSAPVAAMVRLQLLTAARPGEVCQLRPCDVDRSGPVWLYRPGSHKTEHHGRERVIAIGPRAQEVLAPWLLRAADAPCFSPLESAQLARRTGQGRYNAAYTRHSYKTVIQRACDRAFPHPTIRKERGKPLSPELAAELAAWRKARRWHPHQLRHTRATEIRKRYDVEAAQIILGHSKPDTTLIYAERDLAKASEVMREIG